MTNLSERPRAAFPPPLGRGNPSARSGAPASRVAPASSRLGLSRRTAATPPRPGVPAQQPGGRAPAPGGANRGGRPGSSSDPIRVLVVDDSVVIRKLMTEALKDAEGIEVVGTAVNGRAALGRVEQMRPDLVTMDIEMPEMNGIEAVRELRRTGNRLPIVMFSTLTERGAAATLDALAAGASDYVTKPSNTGSLGESMRRVREELVPLIKALVPHKGQQRQAPPAPPMLAPPAGAPGKRGIAPQKPVRAVIIGSSTGGPEALVNVFSHLGEPLPVPIFITQHMPPVFTKQLAARLDKVSKTKVIEVQGGENVEAGYAYLAQGDKHLILDGGPAQTRIKLSDAPPVNFCRPSVDVMFDSAVQTYGGELLSVVLTGMGADGRDGTGQVLRAGGATIAQDQATSVVWGMPGAVAQAGFAQQILPLDQVAQAIVQHVRRGTK